MLLVLSESRNGIRTEVAIGPAVIGLFQPSLALVEEQPADRHWSASHAGFGEMSGPQYDFHWLLTVVPQFHPPVRLVPAAFRCILMELFGVAVIPKREGKGRKKIE
jgi:hypothetical protein